MTALRLALITAVTSLAAAAPAAAQGPTGPTGPTGPIPTITPTPTVTPHHARPGKLSVQVKAPYRGGTALKGDKLVVTGLLKPRLRGQWVQVRLTQGSHTLKSKRVRTRGGGRFRTVLRASDTGRLAVRAKHARSGKIKAATAKARHVVAYTPALGFGSRGALLDLFQKGLRAMKYPAPKSGLYDAATGRAVMAYRKVNDLARLETPSASIIRDVLAGRGGYKVKHPKAGHHVEADISRQILALVDGDKVVRIEPVSSGKPSTPTVMGTYHFYMKTPGTNSHGMVYSNYFIRGYAIHGYADVPSYNASHGCLRIPIPDAVYVYNWVRIGDTIFVEP